MGEAVSAAPLHGSGAGIIETSGRFRTSGGLEAILSSNRRPQSHGDPHARSHPHPDYPSRDDHHVHHELVWLLCAAQGPARREGLAYTEINLEQLPEHVDFVERVNGGNRTVPTVVFPDGSSATNPSWRRSRQARRLSGSWLTARRRRASNDRLVLCPSQCSMIRLAMESPKGRRIGRSNAVRYSSRVTHTASSSSWGSSSISCRRPRREPDHDRRRERPGLVAEVADLGDVYADLLLDLSSHGGLERLARLDEAREHREPVLRPSRSASEQQPVIGVDDGHDHRRIGAGIVLTPVRRADPQPSALRPVRSGSRTGSSGCASRASSQWPAPS